LSDSGRVREIGEIRGFLACGGERKTPGSFSLLNIGRSGDIAGDHERSYEKPEWAAGSSLGAFLLLLADSDRSYAEHWQPRWELTIDPDIEKCPRAPSIWNAG
jgi:hypothetical protein